MGRARYTRVREISRRHDARGAPKINFWRFPRSASPRNFARARVCMPPAPQSPSPKLETTRSLEKCLFLCTVLRSSLTAISIESQCYVKVRSKISIPLVSQVEHAVLHLKCKDPEQLT